jgi:hypothetical protein
MRPSVEPLFRTLRTIGASLVTSAATVAFLVVTAQPALGQCAGATGPCLTPHGTPGCEDADCCQNVCSTDPSCCTAAWDASCVQTAEVSCIGLCGAQVSLSCLVPHETPSCDDLECCESVCLIDSFCCDIRWDFSCVLLAQLSCEIGEPGVCGGPGTESCFEPHASAACDDPVCCETVCSVSPSCCDVSWDSLCAAIAAQTCVGFCQPTCPPGSIQENETCGQNRNDPCFFPSPQLALQTLTCGQAACGTINIAQGPNGLITDVDVWQFTATDPNGDGLSSVQLSLSSGFKGFAALLPAQGCAPLTAALTSIDTQLCIELAGPAVCVPPGAYYIVVAAGTWPNFANTLIDCDFGDSYILRVFCDDLACVPPCSPQGLSCFEPHKAPGCNDTACCELICIADPFCCESNWDGGCVQMAIDQCADVPVNDECSGALPITPGATAFVTFGATDGAVAPSSECIEGGGSPSVRDVWFAYTPTVEGLASASTCGLPITFDSAIEVYSGSCGALTLVACDGNAGCLPTGAATAFWQAACGETYTIRVGGGLGSGTLTLTQFAGPACPDCPEDLDGDGTVGPSDIALLLGSWDQAGSADLDGSGTVGSPDLAILLGAWGPC